jgi:hypothetical protein
VLTKLVVIALGIVLAFWINSLIKESTSNSRQQDVEQALADLIKEFEQH